MKIVRSKSVSFNRVFIVCAYAHNENLGVQVGFVQQGFHCLCLRTQRKPWCSTGTQKNKIILLNTHNNEKCAEQVGFVQQGFHCLCSRTQRKPWCCWQCFLSLCRVVHIRNFLFVRKT